jgi:hypothetical protein
MQLVPLHRGAGASSINFTPGAALLNFPGLHLFSCDQQYDMTAKLGATEVANFRLRFPAGGALYTSCMQLRAIARTRLVSSQLLILFREKQVSEAFAF